VTATARISLELSALFRQDSNVRGNLGGGGMAIYIYIAKNLLKFFKC